MSQFENQRLVESIQKRNGNDCDTQKHSSLALQFQNTSTRQKNFEQKLSTEGSPNNSPKPLAKHVSEDDRRLSGSLQKQNLPDGLKKRKQYDTLKLDLEPVIGTIGEKDQLLKTAPHQKTVSIKVSRNNQDLTGLTSSARARLKPKLTMKFQEISLDLNQ